MKTENVTAWLPDIVGKGYKEFWNCKKRYRVVKGSRASKKIDDNSIESNLSNDGISIIERISRR